MMPMTNYNCNYLICPLCGQSLYQKDGSLVCENNHTFDIARQGYVNLLPVQQKHSLVPGDTAEMLSARRRFLNEGHYSPICGDIVKALGEIPGGVNVLADVGCGEGYYTAGFLRNYPEARIIGADISKAAVRMAASRTRDISWITATASHLPIADGTADGVIAVFSLLCEEEFARVLRPGGRVIEVTSGTDHLIELKRIIYDEVFEQHKQPRPVKGVLKEVSRGLRKFGITLNGGQLADLLLMTPHTMRIKPEKRAILEATPSLGLTVEYYLRVLELPSYR